jgi:glycosyltransferase involved in cell wall biosynthesis
MPVAFLLAILIKAKKINLVHINSNVIFGIPAILASKITKTPCICHIRETRRLNRKERVLAKWINRFIVLTKEALDLYAQDVERNKISIVYNGLDLQEFKSTDNKDKTRQNLGLNGASATIGMVGRIAAGKGHMDFIKAAKIINERFPSVRFLIVGSSVLIDKKIEEELKKTVAEIGLNKNVIFTGWIDDVRQIMSLFDVLVFPSSTFLEGFPRTCIEAMALNKPVIATKIPGPSEIVLDGITGFLVPPHNPNMLANRIIELVGNPELAKNMGFAGRKRTEELFDAKEISKQIENVYLESVKAGRFD